MSLTLDQATSAPGRDAIVERLRERFGDMVSAGAALREQHSHGEGLPLAGVPDAVAFPSTNEDVAALLRFCSDAGLPVVPWGAGTSLEGHVAAVQGGLCMDMGRMAAVLDVSPESFDCRVQAGITRSRLNAELRSTGLFFPIDPGADASVGGMASTRASGTAAVRYGTMRDNVLGLTVVTPDGRVVRTGGRARKSAAGLDLTALYVGSEGTLGLITEIQLRLHPLPEMVSAAVCQFPSTGAAVEAVITALHSGVQFARVELLNDVAMEASILHSHLEGFAALPTLFLEWSGSPASVAEQVGATEAVCRDSGGVGFEFATRPEDRSRLWKARHDAYYAGLSFRPGRKNMGTDACVPIGELARCVRETEADVAELELTAPIVGHVGDGNFHLGILYDPADLAETARAEDLARRVGERAIRLGGTCTGEHGVGAHKRGLLDLEHGAAVGLMRAVKQALDPRGIMNPGKMLSDLT